MEVTGTTFMNKLQVWVNSQQFSITLSLIILILFFITKKLMAKLIRKHAEKNKFEKSRTLYIHKITDLVHFVVFLLLLGVVWEISLSGLSFYFASVFTVVGVALFANWSILSNMTASVILFFFFPFKIGSTIKIQDGDNSIIGVIVDINMFYIEIENSEGELVSYPNNIAIQKPFISIKKS